jgi:transcription antitermination factor NusG
MAELDQNDETAGKNADPAAGKRRWLVLYTRPRFEKKVDIQLFERRIASFLALREEMRQWSDRRKLVQAPLFPGYIFVHVSERERVSALEIDGVVKYVSFGGRFAVVHDEVVESLRLALQRPRDVRIEDTSLKLGQRIRVAHGPMAGMKGRLLAFHGSTRVAIEVEAINQVVSVEVPIGDLAKA